jgi:KUP system potassium uptake protein
MGSTFSSVMPTSTSGGVSAANVVSVRWANQIVLITLRADNNGEGGIFALFSLLKGKSQWAVVLTMIGGSALLADGILMPSITVTSSIEGLRMYNSNIPVIPIVLLILAVLFFIQQFGTNIVGRSFGPISVPACTIWARI